jgi:xylulokinase
LPGTIVGLDSATTAEALARGALVSTAAEVLDALAALDAVGGGEPEDGRLVLGGTVARWPGVAAAVAGLAGRPVIVAHGGADATGAAVLAAATLHGVDPLRVAGAWNLGAGEVVDPPADGPDAHEILARHEAARDAQDALGGGPIAPR